MKLSELRPRSLVEKWYNINDGTRSLMESIVVPEVAAALKAFQIGHGSDNAVLIGGLALSFYSLPRTTQDVDFLFMSAGQIPSFVDGFKKTRDHAFTHKQTGVEIEVLDPVFLKMSEQLAQVVFDTANLIDNIRIASKSGLVALKLGRWSRQDQADIEALFKTGNIDVSPFPLSPIEQQRLSQIETPQG